MSIEEKLRELAEGLDKIVSWSGEYYAGVQDGCMVASERILEILEEHKSGWRPISQAPIVRTRILGWDGERSAVTFRTNDYWALSDLSGWSPTHWMPLPEPPKDKP
jgi:hypothetical protein